MEIRTRPPPPRPNSRRDDQRPYLLERISLRESLERRDHTTSGTVWGMTEAWRTGSALRLALNKRGLDRAERDGLVDKLYNLVDRRGTAARLTRSGVELRQKVERVLQTLPTIDRPRGVAYGIRQCPTWADI
jgi:hypothetical protein